ncbi:MAG: amidase, partial [Gemmatimonadaceae bacterium]
MNTRRQFLIQAPIGLLGVLAACRGEEQHPAATNQATPGAPTAFNTAPPVGPDVTPSTFAEAEKLEQVTMTAAQREMASKSWRTSMAPLLERRTGPRTIALEATLAPATVWNQV